MDKLLEIKELNLSIGDLQILKDITFGLVRGEKVGLIGESGSGKSMMARAILGLNKHIGGLTQQGEILWHRAEGRVELGEESTSLQQIRKSEIGIVFQQSAQVFNPSQCIGVQLLEKLDLRLAHPKAVLECLAEVELRPAQRFYDAYPHQLSGGQLQRALIALALINEPQLLIADEPLSALDSETEQQLLSLIKKIVTERSAALLIISHDLHQIFELCDSLVVLENGSISEFGNINDILKNPQSKLTQSFIKSQNTEKHKPFDHGEKEVLVTIKDISMTYKNSSSFFTKNKKSLEVLRNFSLDIAKCEIVGLYGKSGTGKSTIARLIMKLENLKSGEIFYKNRSIARFDKNEIAQYRKQVQIIFQDPFNSMSPHRTIRQHFEDASQAMSSKLNDTEMISCLEKVGLEEAHLSRIPKQLSGGERQRVLIARALYMNVEFLVCDEILSSLDVIVSEEILALLKVLVKEKGLTLLFISHDIKVLESFCNRIVSLDRVDDIE